MTTFARRHGLTPQRVWWRKRLAESTAPATTAERGREEVHAIVLAVVSSRALRSEAVIARVCQTIVLKVVEPACVAPAWLGAVLLELAGKPT